MLTDIDNAITDVDSENRSFSDSQLVSLIRQGLPLTERPYREIARTLGVSEHEVIRRIGNMVERGVIKRFGIIVKHHELGFRANAMTVWNIPDGNVHNIAALMKDYPFVTLCYRRPRKLPDWPYKLFCMIHGKDRDTVLGLLDDMIVENSWQEYTHEILFSKRRFKQCGASI